MGSKGRQLSIIGALHRKFLGNDALGEELGGIARREGNLDARRLGMLRRVGERLTIIACRRWKAGESMVAE